MKKRQSNMVPFSPERVEQAIRFSGLKMKDLFLEEEQFPGNGQMLARSYRRRKKTRTIKPANLEWLAEKLNVATAYLRGDLDWPLEELPNEDYVNAYKEMFLNPADYPYRGRYHLQNSIDYKEYERQLLEIHGIDHSQLSTLRTVDQLNLLASIDDAITKQLEKSFSGCTRIDYRDIYQGYDLDDIIEILAERLAGGQLDPDFAEEDDEGDRFAVKYLREKIEKKTWGYKYLLDVAIEGEEPTSWQAEAIFKLEGNWDSVDALADRLVAYIKSNAVELEDASVDDLYWTVRPKALEVSALCSRNTRLVSLVCDCRLGEHRELRLQFLNEELNDIRLV